MAGRPTGSTNKNTVAKKPVEEVKKAETKVEIKVEAVKNITNKRLKLDDNVLISVKSNVFGRLIYINKKTGDKTVWENFDEAQPLTVGDLRAMKGTQAIFFKENWITIEGIEEADSEYDDVQPEEIYEALQVSQYYTEMLCPKNINSVFNWTVDEIRNKVPKMNKGVRESLAIRSNELIKEGILDSISKVKALEEVLGCELASSDD